VSFGGKRALALLTTDPGLDAGSDDTSGVPIAPSTLALNSLNGDTLPPPGGCVDGDEVDTAMIAPMPTDWTVEGGDEEEDAGESEVEAAPKATGASSLAAPSLEPADDEAAAAGEGAPGCFSSRPSPLASSVCLLAKG
jgi:hypothetical protein